MEPALLQMLVLLIAVAVMLVMMFLVLTRARRTRAQLRAELGRQRDDSLRSIKLMLQQMDYDAAVLRLLRHAQNMRDAGRMEEFSGAIDTLQKRENDMMDRVDRVHEFESHLRARYGKRQFLARPGKRGDEATPEQIKKDIRKFLETLERIRTGEPMLLEEKISFFEKWVESPKRHKIYNSLNAMALFLEKGDSSGLEELQKDGNGGKGA
jgi:hypothetical protein